MKFTHTISIKVEVELHDIRQAVKAAAVTEACASGASPLGLLRDLVKDKVRLIACDFTGSANERRYSKGFGQISVKVHEAEITDAEITTEDGIPVRIYHGSAYQQSEGDWDTGCRTCDAAYGCPLCIALCGDPFECRPNTYWNEVEL